MNFRPAKIELPALSVYAEYAEVPVSMGMQKTWELYRKKYYSGGGMVFWGNAIKSSPRLSVADIASFQSGVVPPKKPADGVRELWKIERIDNESIPFLFMRFGFLDEVSDGHLSDVFNRLNLAAKPCYFHISMTQLVAYIEPLPVSEKVVRQALENVAVSFRGIENYHLERSFVDDGVKHGFISITRSRPR